MSPQAENLYNFPPDSQEVSGSGIRRSFQDPSNHFATQLLCLSDGTYRIPSQPDNSFALPEPPACSDINSDWSNNATLAPIGDQSEISQWSIPGATDSFSLACVQADDYNEMAFVNSAPHESRAGRPRKQSGSGTSQCPKERRREQERAHGTVN
ncbi:hypothetical protein I204_00427 [Kwoniella mangroviensis CBS 8886]|uniref:uncharacterized protein n=1 Tax=Kwoniella mangroviensis CBS 8507 TaxID=1296122 RepID=UPI00080D50BE|nr:uncharacterized protein I203_06717 [Kwoniella mangroviensis CBS 8507]OCF64133.1 hypothetical protein I203_06717 [Kwoniella mangroviensis CBS 8507]OCF78487.1 hypothetical protein I204_00427 [Kwoniella mangroviensis CBS 8886]